MRTGPRHSPPAYRFAVTVLRPLLMSLTKRQWSGAEHLPRDRGFIAVSNHVSHVDPFVFAHFLNDEGIVPHFLAKVEAFKVPVVGAVLRGAEQIPVYRESGQAGDAYGAAVAAIEDGQCVAIYPEGTVTREPALWPMRGKTGAARIALATGCPVIPIAQWGAQEILAPYAHRPSLLPRHTMQVSAGQPVGLDDLRDQPVTAEVLAEATERIMAALTSQLEVLRGETAPPGRFDPKVHGLTLTGRPKEVTSDPSKRARAAEWGDDDPDDVEDQA
ncbi:acyltransferase [Knoellia sinensis KCTC 19936]|uniref:Acyltransferase n=2 Tax=Knoellia TaxID=136099 RepID=A0A0A0J512_9MICO|nr:acyltransferase [Knoellia sinensis KCTC 19936]